MKDVAYELLAQRYDELEQDKAELAEILDRTETERDALAAHMTLIAERKDRLEAKRLMPARLAGIIEEAPATSLARRDAEVIRSLRFPTMLRKMWSGGDVQRWLDEQAEEKLRQAEG